MITCETDGGGGLSMLSVMISFFILLYVRASRSLTIYFTSLGIYEAFQSNDTRGKRYHSIDHAQLAGLRFWRCWLS